MHPSKIDMNEVREFIKECAQQAVDDYTMAVIAHLGDDKPDMNREIEKLRQDAIGMSLIANQVNSDG